MKIALLLFLMCSPLLTITGQNTKRIEISGKIVVDSDDLEGITIYNTSAKKGTFTDEKGLFKLKVALNDIIEVRSLKFQDFTLTIDDNIIRSKKVTIFLVEDINKLDEVVVLPYDLSGNLTVDIESVRTFNPKMDAIYFGIANMNEYEFPDDYKSQVVNIAMRGPGNDIKYGLNVIGIVGLFLKPAFNKDKSNKKVEVMGDIEADELTDHYSAKFLIENFNIPENKVDAFIAYVEEEGLDYSLLKSGKEFEFLEYISAKSKAFLEKERGK